MACHAEDVKRVDARIQTHALAHLWVRSADITVEDVTSALKTSHVASLFLGRFLNRVDRLFALSAIYDGIVFTTTVDIRDLMLLIAFAWLSAIVTERVLDADVHELRLIAFVSESLEERT